MTAGSDVFIPSSMPEGWRKLITASASMATWKRHRSALACIELFAKYKNCSLSWPLTENFKCDFILWAFEKKKLSCKTIKLYLSSLELYQSLNCKNYETTKSTIADRMLKGIENVQLFSGMTKNVRKVCSFHILKILSHEIARQDWTVLSKQVIWTLCTVAFFGSFRLGELLPNSRENASQLYWSHVKFLNNSVRINVVVSKTKKNEHIDLYELNSSYCPVKALRKLFKLSNDVYTLSDKSPVFKFENNFVLTTAKATLYIRNLLRSRIGSEADFISGHSFRAAIPSVLANRPDIANDQDICVWGRWSSDSYKLYTRLTPDRRKFIFEKIVKCLNM
jgi:hypothetical protein